MLASIKTFLWQLCYVYGWVYLLSTIFGLIIAGIAILRIFLYVKINNGRK